MVFDWILDRLEALLTWFAGVLPDVTVSDAWGGFSSLLSQLTALNYWLPISKVATFVGAIFLLVPVLLGGSLVAWLVAFIRGGSARA